MYFLSKSGKWWTGSHRQCPLPPPPYYPQSFCLLHLSFRYLSTLSLSFALSIPKSLSFPGLPLLDKSDAKFRDVFLSGTRTRKREDHRQNGLSNPCLSSFIYLFEKCEVVTEITLCLLSLCRCHNFFCPPIKCQWPHSCPRMPHLNWQHIQITSFSSVGLCFIKLGACWGSNRISLPFKLQLQTWCHWAWPSLHSYFPL